MSSVARLRFTFHLPDAAAEWAGAALSDLFPDGLLLVPQPGGVTRLQGWLAVGASRRASEARKRLEYLGARRVSQRPDQPRLKSSQQHGRFPVLRMGRFVIVPAAQAASAKLPKQSLPIVLIQGQAFGSGRHESTRLMLQIIASRPPLGQDVLDVGAGSGILGFACLHLGARRTVSVEVESAACDELRRNRTLNGVAPGCLPVLCGRYPLKRLQGRRFPWVLGNLVTPVLVALMPRLGAQVAPQGTLLCSGIHTDPEAEAVVAAARKAGLALKERAQLRQWNVLRFLRP